jgi:hypothetical protein
MPVAQNSKKKTIMKKNTLNTLVPIALLLLSCSPKTEKKELQHNSNTMLNRKYDDDEITISKTCILKDGTFDAEVYYFNQKTGYTNNYTLKTVVEDCLITQIHFPNGGFLDKNHISSTPIDQDGKATVTTDDNKTYELNITE